VLDAQWIARRLQAGYTLGLSENMDDAESHIDSYKTNKKWYS